MLVILLVDELKDKKKEEIQEKLKKDVEALQEFDLFLSALVVKTKFSLQRSNIYSNKT